MREGGPLPNSGTSSPEPKAIPLTNVVDQRHHTRFRYRIPSLAGIFMGDRPMGLVECSERGIRFKLGSGPERPAVGSLVDGIIWFRHGDTVPVAGTVVRVTGDEVAARLDVGIPQDVLMKERRYLRGPRSGLRW